MSPQQRFLEDYEAIIRAEEAIEEPESRFHPPQADAPVKHSRWRSAEEYREWRALQRNLEDILAENDP